jgi:hypothetical protein
MSYPKYMDDEMLVVFGFSVDPDNPRLAKNLTYPRLSVRYRCPQCRLWSGPVTGGVELLCQQCHQGKKPYKIDAQYLKLYQCCNKGDCTTWNSVLSLFREAGISTENSHDGFGSYIQIKCPASWGFDDRIDFHKKLNQFCVSKHKARKVQCNPNRKMKSKLPKVESR